MLTVIVKIAHHQIERNNYFDLFSDTSRGNPTEYRKKTPFGAVINSGSICT